MQMQEIICREYIKAKNLEPESLEKKKEVF